ncbi:MAG: hypothetical protein WBP26_05010 [Candidatus Saccharimonadales bacterium]
MVTLNTFQGQTNGVAASTGNSGNSGTAFTGVFLNGGSMVYSDAHGSMALQATGVSGATTYVECTSFGNDLDISTAIDYYVAATKSSNRTIFQIRNAGGIVSSVLRNTNGTLSMADAGGGVRWTSTTNFDTAAANTWVRIELQVHSDASAGTMHIAVFPQASTTPTESSTTITGRNTRGGVITTYRMGKPDSGADTQPDWFDNVRSQDGVLLSLGPYVPENSFPIANAGDDIGGIEPGTTQTLNGTDSDSDGTVVARSWRQVSGASVVLSGTGAVRTYVAPGTLSGTTLVFGYTVTDDEDAESVESTVTHIVLAATERAVAGGVEVPVQTRIVLGGTEI